MKLLKRFSLSRRHVLSGLTAGGMVSLGLPPLEAMFNAHGDAHAGGEPLPKRLVTWLWGNGVDLEAFEPDTTGPRLHPAHDARAARAGEGLRDGPDRAVESVRELHHPPSGDGGAVGDTTTSRVPICRVSPRTGADRRSTRSSRTSSPIRPRFPCARCSWGCRGICRRWTTAPSRRRSRRAASRETSSRCPPSSSRSPPGRTCSASSCPSPTTGSCAARRSTWSGNATDRLRTKLGTADNQRLDAHLQGVAELEARIAALPPPCTIPDSPTLVNDFGLGLEPLTEITEIMCELIAMAFRCDITRVASVQALHIAAEVPLTEIGQTDTHHNESHQNSDIYREGVRYLIGQVATLMQILQGTEDLLGNSLLDSTIVYATTEVAVGYTHQVNRQPLIVGGHGDGHLVYPGIHHQAVPAASPHGSSAPSAGNISDVLLANPAGLRSDRDGDRGRGAVLEYCAGRHFGLRATEPRRRAPRRRTPGRIPTRSGTARRTPAAPSPRPRARRRVGRSRRRRPPRRARW